MKTSIEITMRGLVAALRLRLHAIADEAEEARREPAPRPETRGNAS